VFQHLKTFLSGRQFHNDSEVKEAKWFGNKFLFFFFDSPSELAF
jgi:hypothetical protein